MKSTKKKPLSALALLLAPLSAFAQIPSFLAPDIYSLPGAAMVAIGDFNGDGLPDMVAAGSNGVSILMRNSNATFQTARRIAAGNVNAVAVGDFNNDGRLDIAIGNGLASNRTVSILLGKGDGTFQPSIEISTFATPGFSGVLSLAVSDFNGDGKLDLAAAEDITASIATGTTNEVVILLGNGDGTFATGESIPGGRVVTGDFNHDGKPDLYVYGPGQAVQVSSIKLGNGDGTFRDGPVNAIPAGAKSILLADLNRDGNLDFVAHYSQPARAGAINGTLVFLGVGDGTFVQPPSLQPNPFVYLSGSNPVAVDFNHDGNLDLVGPAEVYLGEGDGTFGQFPTVGFLPTFTSGGTDCEACLASADFGRHGAPDLIFAAFGTISVFRNTGGNPPTLAQLTLDATATVGGSATVNGTISLGGPAPVGGTIVALASSNPAAFFPGGATVSIPAGSSTASFRIFTSAVGAMASGAVTATWNETTLSASLEVVRSFAISSISIAPASLPGFFSVVAPTTSQASGNPAVGTVTLSGPASDGVLISLISSNPAAIAVPASVQVAAGAKTATFPLAAMPVAVDTPVAISGSFQGVTKSGTVTDLKPLDAIVITKAEFTVKANQLKLEATGTIATANLRVYNATTGQLLGTMIAAGGGKFTGQFLAFAPLTSVALQSDKGGLAIAPPVQK